MCSLYNNDSVDPRGYLQYTWQRGLTELHIVNPKIYMSLKFYTQKNYLASNFLPQKCKTGYLNTDLFNQQTWGPKKIRDILLDPKKYRGCKFSTQKKTSDLPVRFTASNPPPLGWWHQWQWRWCPMHQPLLTYYLIVILRGHARYELIYITDKKIKAKKKRTVYEIQWQ